jgi:NAD+ kinase
LSKKYHHDEDVVIIQKQTALERYTKHISNVDFLDYLSQDKISKQELKEAHKIHENSREVLLGELKKLNLNYAIYNLDELKETQLCFFDENKKNSGLNPKKKLVIALGGDGTLLHASHHIGGDVTLLGINSCPQNSVGHLCAAHPKDIPFILKKVLVEKNYPIQKLQRLHLKCARHKNTPLALNDIFVSHLHPAATSRYQMSLLDKNGHTIESEKQLSSGVWMSTAAGSTAAISSYNFPPEPLASRHILVAVREPYHRNGVIQKMNHLVVDGDTQKISLFSRMRQGIVCIDGSDFSIQFGFGETIEVSSSEKGALLLIRE